jgi:hypothetical protein
VENHDYPESREQHDPDQRTKIKDLVRRERPIEPLLDLLHVGRQQDRKKSYRSKPRLIHRAKHHPGHDPTLSNRRIVSAAT